MTSIKFNQVPARTNIYTYSFKQPLKDIRPDKILNSKIALSQLSQDIRTLVRKNGNEYKIAFLDIYNGILLPPEIFENDKLSNLRNNKPKELRKKDELLSDEDRIKYFVKTDIEEILHSKIQSLITAERNGISFVRILGKTDYKFNSSLFWMLYYLEMRGVGVVLGDYMESLLYTGKEYDVMYHTINYLMDRDLVPTINICNIQFGLLPSERNYYYTNYSELRSKQSLDVVSDVSNVQIAWSPSRIVDINCFLKNAYDESLKKQSTIILAVHEWFRFNHLHFHVFTSVEDVVNYMWHNIDRTWQSYQTLQTAAVTVKHGRNTYNFSLSIKDYTLFKLQLLCATPPPTRHTQIGSKTINDMMNYYNDIVFDRNFICNLNTLWNMYSNPNNKFLIYNDLYVAYITLFKTNYATISNFVVKLIFSPMIKQDIATPLLPSKNYPVTWAQLPTGEKIKPDVNDINWITTNYGITPHARKTKIDASQIFGVKATPFWLFYDKANVPQDVDPSKWIDLVKFKARMLKYRSDPWHSMRNGANDTNGTHGKYTAKDIAFRLSKDAKLVISTNWKMLLIHSLLVDGDLPKLNDYNFSILRPRETTVRYNQEYNNSSPKLLSLFMFMIEKMCALTENEELSINRDRIISEKVNRIMKENHKLMIIGAIKDPLGPAVSKAFPGWGYSGIGNAAYDEYLRTDVDYYPERASGTIIIDDTDQAREGAFGKNVQEITDKVLRRIAWCSVRATYAYAVKIQYCNADMLARIFNILNAGTRTYAYVVRCFYEVQLSAECFFVLVKVGPDRPIDTVAVLNDRACEGVELPWKTIDYKIDSQPIMEQVSQMKNLQIMNVDNFKAANCNTLSAATNSINDFKILLSYMLMFCDRVKTGRLTDSQDIFLLYGMTSIRRMALQNRAGSIYKLQIHDDSITPESIGQMSRIENTQFYGIPQTSTGLYNLGLKIQTKMLIEIFRKATQKWKLKVLSIGDGSMESVTCIEPDDVFTIIDPVDIPGVEIYKIRHLKEKFQWTRKDEANRDIPYHQKEVEDADVILMTFSAMNIYDPAGMIDFLSNKMRPILDKANHTKPFDKNKSKLFIFNYYTIEGGEKYRQEVFRVNGYVPADISKEDVPIDSTPPIKYAWHYTFGTYQPVEPISLKEILGIRSKVAVDTFLYQRDWITYEDIHNAAVKFNTTNNIFLSTILDIYNEMAPTLVSGLPPRDQIFPLSSTMSLPTIIEDDDDFFGNDKSEYGSDESRFRRRERKIRVLHHDIWLR